ncbi:MAG: acetyl-CoA C-acetyltransferase [Candidatus Eisenbacteria bacterium]|uniref:Acetyl-CoA C-acetyltransferase n=1 Tax=Eiseniibacteriota bacterium TaxID=2212470 RepID=A0A538TD25_UNCEI|nr:MAG: acetyl-CoA C-acetyltransferase [Candidatus Eisenbacteria bacterium]
MKALEGIVIVSGARTAMAEWIGGKRGDGLPGGALASVSAIDLGAAAARGAIERAGVGPETIDHVVMGNALQTSGDALYGARHVGLKVGVPKEVPALTVNRLCGSGHQAVVDAAQMIALGEAAWVLAGGMENMSQAPHVLRGARGGIRLGPGGQLEDSLWVALKDSYCGLFMAQTSDNLARKYGITREQQDEFAYRSHSLSNAANNDGRFAEERVPVTVQQGKKTVVVDRDDHLFPNTTLEGLAKLPPAFGPESFVTAGNASGIVDGAAAVVVTSAERARAAGKKPLGFVRAWAAVGVAPEIMGFGPAPAIRKALERAGLELDDIDLFEINEAFAGQYLAVEKELGLDRDKVNVNGGAIGLGHPLGATGTRLIYTLLVELGKRQKRWGIASACIGGGQGIAVIVERT